MWCRESCSILVHGTLFSKRTVDVKWVTWIVSLLFVFAIPYADAYPLTEIKLLSDDVTSVYDGDTLTVQVPYIPDVFGKDLSVRIAGIDTPEMRSTCATKEQRDHEKALAIRARDVVIAMVASGHRVTLTNLDRDKYFRMLASVYVDGRSVSDELIAQGLAVPYSGDTKIGWCG